MVLFHYTNSTGLLGILENRTLWSTHAMFMNDYKELKYGTTIVTSDLEQKIRNSQGVKKENLTSILKDYTEMQSNALVFIACFCEEDDLLSQWRAYAANGQGYSIGFESDDLKKGDHLFLLLKVIYEIDEQNKEIENELRNVGDEKLGISATLEIVLRLLTTTCILKHSRFREEKEWRLIDEYYEWSPGTGGPPRIKFRTVNNQIVPYREIKLSCLKGFRNTEIVPIHSITIGPSNNENQVKEVLSWLFFELGYIKKVNIEKSSIPYRM